MLRPIVLFALLLGGCRNIVGPAGSGTYSAEVTGAFTASYSGSMIYQPRSVTAGPGYALHLKLPNDLFNGILFQLSGRPQLGTYTVVTREQDLGRSQVFSGLSLPDAVYHGTAGELRVRGTSPFRGTFHFEARKNSGGVIKVSGEFTEEL